MKRWSAGMLALAVVLAFADASVVVLALPAMYGDYDTSIVGVSWVITAYAVVVAAVGFALAAVHPRRPLETTVTGLVLFAGASAWCAVAPTLGWLVAGRCAQGLGGALLLVGSSAVLAHLHPAGRRLWAAAGTVGLALGPALGGVLTEWFDWRAIFAVQAPVAALAVLVVADPEARRAGPVQPGPVGLVRAGTVALAGLGLVAVSGALVGALFLGVLLVVEVWQYSPIAGAAVVSALPAGTLGAVPLRRAAGLAARALAGALILAMGLVALAWLPAASAWWAAAALATCGIGFGLATGVLDQVTDGTAAGQRAGALAIGCRHGGLVLGLLLVAPVLAGDLEAAREPVAVTGAATVLEARLDVRDKVRVARALRDEVERTPRGQMPDLERPFAGAGAERADVGAELRRRIEAVLTRAFRGGFFVAAAFALVAAVPTLLLATRRLPTLVPSGPSRALGPLGLGGLVVVAAGLVATEVHAGGTGFGTWPQRDPCHASPDPYPGRGLDAALQRILLGALDGAACELGTSRERLVLSLDGDTGLGSVTWDRDTVERAVRSGMVRAVDNAADRGSLPGWAAGPLRQVAGRAPVQLLLGTADRVSDTLSAISREAERILDWFRR